MAGVQSGGSEAVLPKMIPIVCKFASLSFPSESRVCDASYRRGGALAPLSYHATYRSHLRTSGSAFVRPVIVPSICASIRPSSSSSSENISGRYAPRIFRAGDLRVIGRRRPSLADCDGRPDGVISRRISIQPRRRHYLGTQKQSDCHPTPIAPSTATYSIECIEFMGSISALRGEFGPLSGCADG